MFKITVIDLDYAVIQCNEGENLLDATKRQGITIPYACKSGGCGLCKVKIETGQYQYGTSSKAVLSDSEREENYSLACKTYLQSDAEIVIDLSRTGMESLKN